MRVRSSNGAFDADVPAPAAAVAAAAAALGVCTSKVPNMLAPAAPAAAGGRAVGRHRTAS